MKGNGSFHEKVKENKDFFFLSCEATDPRSRRFDLDKLNQREVRAFPHVLSHYDLLHPHWGQCFSLISFMISPNFLWALRKKLVSTTSFWSQPEGQGGLPAMATIALKPVSNLFLLLFLMWTNGVGLVLQISLKPCSLLLPLVFSIWEQSCEEQGAYLSCSCVGISAATLLGDSLWRGDVGPICRQPRKLEDAQCWLFRDQILSVWCSRPPPTSVDHGAGFGVCVNIFIFFFFFCGRPRQISLS